MSFLAPLFFVGLAAAAVPIFVHLIQRERRNVVEFPSLMFIRRIPFQSTERRRIHNWPLLLMRLAALALIVAAFTRPFFRVDPVKAAARATGSREIVILLDRSASMGYGNHWPRAQDEARKIVSGMSGDDRATLVLFDNSPEEAVRATADRGSLTAAIGEAKVSSGATRFAPALRVAQSKLNASDRTRREVFLISDFQRSGWARQEEIHLPDGATITPVPVGELDTANVSVSSVSLARGAFSGQDRVTITAGVVNRSGLRVANLPVQLEIDGRYVGTRNVTVEPNGTGSVTFDPITIGEPNTRGVVRAGTDAMASDNTFYFVLSPSRPLSVLVLQNDAADRRASVYLTTVLGLSKAPPFKTDVVAASRVTPGQLDGRSLVVVNDAALSSATADALRAFVERGGGLFIALGDRNPAGSGWTVFPGTLGSAVDRLSSRGGTLGFLDYSHPIFEQFKDPRNGNFVNMRFLKYRTIMPAPTDRVLARFDDGAAALVERRAGSGRVIAFASTIDGDWNDVPKHGMYLPLMHEIAAYLSQYDDPSTSQTVGRVLDISAPVAALVREGQLSAGTSTSVRAARGVVVAPDGTQTTLGEGGAPSIPLSEQGFYSVRLSGAGDRRPFEVAVDIDPAESDLSSLPPADFLASAIGQAAVARNGLALEPPDLTPADMEKKQAIWWFLLVAGLGLLVAESVLSNRISPRSGLSSNAGAK
jgi:hypothetical protein